MKAPRELIAAQGAALLRLLDAKDMNTRGAAQREYDMLCEQVSKIEALREFAPIGGDAQNLIRGR